ncbi:class I SAM-dependent methyltransferase [Aminobacter niigataensis]|uniref:class I SAM-dependent methyltransferase n=1 Tax=Aminobacter niigataensis TaxID=83265 RepID=UPI0024CD84A1|nr:class I SAM-dependent methyltransferase [Aminobacter niigataensis]CAI2934778.1 Trans-aconitate methyltransferase [Aminobacter niigataensis]
MTDDRKSHWDTIYGTKAEDDVSWFQKMPEPSMTLLSLAGATPGQAIIDIGGGASHLVDALLDQGFGDVSVLDISQAALEANKARLGAAAQEVHWICSDATAWQPARHYDVWHDRAAFHFLTDPADQAGYMSALKQALVPGGHAIIGTFAPDGPEKCSGLPIVRHDAQSIGRLLGSGFELVDSCRHEHKTPWDSVQHFQFGTFRKRA